MPLPTLTPHDAQNILAFFERLDSIRAPEAAEFLRLCQALGAIATYKEEGETAPGDAPPPPLVNGVDHGEHVAAGHQPKAVDPPPAPPRGGSSARRPR